MSDLTEKIDTWKTEFKEFAKTLNLCKDDYKELVEYIDEVPQPERKKGKWIPLCEDEDGEHYGDKCSVCGGWYVMPHEKARFCPGCGADMRGEQDDSV